MARPHPAGGLSPGKGENAASAPFGALWGVFALVNRSYFSSFNSLLGELIGRGNEFSPYPDPEDPSRIILSICVFHQDRISNGRLLPD